MEHAFPCGNPALDFVGTLRARRSAAPLDVLESPERLDAWYCEAGIVDKRLKSQPADLDAAVRLREAVYLLVIAALDDKAYDETALAIVNEVARTPSVIPELTQAGRRTLATPQQALSSVAREAIGVLGGDEAIVLKECANPGCTQIYIDQSRGARREWCAMDPCGNRMKAAAYRARKRAEPKVSARKA